MEKFEDGSSYFFDDLNRSREYEPMWIEFYQKKFPGYLHIESTQETKLNKSKEQNDGIDRIITEADGTRTFVEEKIVLNVYDEISFEWMSNDVSGKPGWIEDEYLCNYLAYAFIPIKTIYFYDWKALKKMWKKYGEHWKKSKGCKQIVKTTTMPNLYTYRSLSTAVPIYIVDQCYKEMLIKKCVETVSTQLISDQERIDIMDEILRIKNETPEEKQKKLIKRIKELKNEQGTQNKDAGETIS